MGSNAVEILWNYRNVSGRMLIKIGENMLDDFYKDDLIVESIKQNVKLAKVGIHLPFRPDEIALFQSYFDKEYGGKK